MITQSTNQTNTLSAQIEAQISKPTANEKDEIITNLKKVLDNQAFVIHQLTNEVKATTKRLQVIIIAASITIMLIGFVVFAIINK